MNLQFSVDKMSLDEAPVDKMAYDRLTLITKMS